MSVTTPILTLVAVAASLTPPTIPWNQLLTLVQGPTSLFTGFCCHTHKHTQVFLLKMDIPWFYVFSFGAAHLSSFLNSPLLQRIAYIRTQTSGLRILLPSKILRTSKCFSGIKLRILKIFIHSKTTNSLSINIFIKNNYFPKQKFSFILLQIVLISPSLSSKKYWQADKLQLMDTRFPKFWFSAWNMKFYHWQLILFSFSLKVTSMLR